MDTLWLFETFIGYGHTRLHMHRGLNVCSMHKHLMGSQFLSEFMYSACKQALLCGITHQTMKTLPQWLFCNPLHAQCHVYSISMCEWTT